MGNKSSRARAFKSPVEELRFRDANKMTDQELFALFEAEESQFPFANGAPPSRQGVAPTYYKPVNDRLGGGPLRPPALHEDIAWAIAMAFYPQLHTHVVLITDRLTQDFDLVKSYEWITFDVEDHTSGASIARAATTTWFWLSSCPGYSGRENPRFWKRVYCELGRPFPKKKTIDERTTRSPMRSASLTIRITPRVKSIPPAGLNRNDHQDDAHKWDEKLKDIWLQLQPFIAKGRLHRPVDVTVMTGKWSGTEIDELVASPEIVAQGGMMVLPLFVLPSSIASARMPQPVDIQKQSQYPEVVHISTPHLPLRSEASSCEKATKLRALFCVGPRLSDHMRGQVHRFLSTYTTASEFAAICSVLPHSQSFHTVKHSGSKYFRWHRVHYVRELDLLDWAWLGYALFHPDTQASKWCNLEIYVGELTADAVCVLGIMAKGNNLVQVLESMHANMPTTDATASLFYHSAQVHEGTRLRAEPIDSSETLLNLHGFTWVCLCVDDPSSLVRWVRVVAPGVGFGWILSTSIKEIVSRSPGKSSVQSLCLQIGHMRGGMPTVPELLPGFLSLLGGSVTNLEIVNGVESDTTTVEIIEGCDLDAATVRAILMECPVLKSLRVKHDGSLWAGADVEQLPPLQRLWLIVQSDFQAPSTIALATCLRELTHLRISALEYKRCPQQTQLAFIKLLECHPMLQYLHYSDRSCLAANRRKDKGMFPYVNGRLRTQEFFSELPPRALYGDFAPFSAACQLAFLSVIRKERLLPLQEDDDGSKSRPPSALGRLDRDVATQIFAFASSLAPRDLWFGGE